MLDILEKTFFQTLGIKAQEPMEDGIASRVRPNIELACGNIEVNRFDESNGTLYVRLLGACVSCPSSTVTLKFQVERVLAHYVHEVKEVVSIPADADEYEDTFKLSFTPLKDE